MLTRQLRQLCSGNDTCLPGRAEILGVKVQEGVVSPEVTDNPQEQLIDHHPPHFSLGLLAKKTLLPLISLPGLKQKC